MVGTGLHLGDLDLGMVGQLHLLVVIQQFLVQLLPFTQAGKLYFYIHAYLLTGKLNHATGKVHNLDRATHVKHVDLSPITHDGRLQHQLAGLGNGHEVAGDVWMGHRQRSSICQLLLE